MVVATGAGNRQPQKATSRGVYLVVYLVVRVVVEHPAKRQKAHPRQAPGGNLWLLKIGRELVLNKFIERQVLVESADDIITIGVGIRTKRIFAVDQHQVFGVRITRHV